MEKNLAPLIKKKIENHLGLGSVEVINNSHFHQSHHSSPKTGNSHFKLIVQKKELMGLNRIQIHRKVYTALKDELSSFVHSLEIEISE